MWVLEISIIVYFFCGAYLFLVFSLAVSHYIMTPSGIFTQNIENLQTIPQLYATSNYSLDHVPRFVIFAPMQVVLCMITEEQDDGAVKT